MAKALGAHSAIGAPQLWLPRRPERAILRILFVRGNDSFAHQ
jgi:hypothetical protein